MTSMEEKIIETQLQLIDKVKKKKSSGKWWNHYISEGYSEEEPLLKNLTKLEEELGQEVKILKQELMELTNRCDMGFIHKENELLLTLLDL